MDEEKNFKECATCINNCDKSMCEECTKYTALLDGPINYEERDTPFPTIYHVEYYECDRYKSLGYFSTIEKAKKVIIKHVLEDLDVGSYEAEYFDGVDTLGHRITAHILE